MRVVRMWGVWSAALALTACVHGESQKTRSPSPKEMVAKDGAKATKAEEKMVVEEKRQHCLASPLSARPPFFLSDQKLMITRIAKPCETVEGRPGYDMDTSWMAMGFPCTAGGGRLQYRDNFTNPKFVTFSVPNSCPLEPDSREAVGKIGHDVVGLSMSAKLLAYYPLAVQYWELVDYPDADVGYVVDLRSAKSREDGWTKFRTKKDPLRVRLYGRENAWVKDNRLYRAEGQFVYLGKNDFRFEVTDARALGEDEMDEVKKRCESLRPARPCSDVFQ